MRDRFRSFTVLISNINRSIKKIKTEEMEEFDLKSPHVSCLYYLYKMGKMTATEICGVSKEDKAAMSRAVEYLEKIGLVLCDSDLKKRYRCALTLTEKGKEVGARIVEKADGIVEKASVGITEEMRAVLYESLAIIDANLEKMCDQYEGE